MGALFYTGSDGNINPFIPLLMLLTLISLATVIVMYFRLRKLKKSGMYVKIDLPKDTLTAETWYLQMFEWANYQIAKTRKILQSQQLVALIAIVTSIVTMLFLKMTVFFGCIIILISLYIFFSVSASERLIKEMTVDQLSQNLQKANEESFVEYAYFVHQNGKEIIYVDLDYDNQDRYRKITKAGKQWFITPIDQNFDVTDKDTIPIKLKFGLLSPNEYLQVLVNADILTVDPNSSNNYLFSYNEYEYVDEDEETDETVLKETNMVNPISE